MKAITLFLLLLAAMPATGQDRIFHLPFSDARGIILLDVKVNDKPTVLMLDTGAITTLFYTPGLVEIRVSEHDVVAVHANDLGRMSNNNRKSMALLGITGILGQDFLHNFKSVRIDYANHVVDLEPR